MWRPGTLQGWRIDRPTLGLVIFGFSAISAAGSLTLANSELGVVFNTAPPAPNGFGLAPFSYPTAERIDAGAIFLAACAAAFAAVGGLAMFLRARWGGPVAAIALAAEAAAVLVSIVDLPEGVYVIGRALTVIWLIALALLASGYRPRPVHLRPGPGAPSWMEEAFGSDDDVGPDQT